MKDLFPKDADGKIIPICWDDDPHTQFCRANGWPTGWIDEYNNALAAERQAEAAAKAGSPPPPPGSDPHSDVPHLTAWVAKCEDRFKHQQIRKQQAAELAKMDVGTTDVPNLTRYIQRCLNRFKHHQQ